MNARAKFRIAQIARLRVVGGVKDKQIGEMLGLSSSGLARILTLPEYLDEENRILEGGVSSLDEAIAGKLEEQRSMFEIGVPVALRTLLEVAVQRRDLRAALNASKELLNRDPQGSFLEKRPGAGTETPSDSLTSGIVDQITQETRGVISQMAHGADPTKMN